MKITVFQANQGDCLLITGGAGHNILIDGGMKGSYKDHVAWKIGAMADDEQEMDLVCVTHIDQDHINGIVQYFDDLSDWRVLQFQQQSGNTTFPEPKRRKPPEVKEIWHNTFTDLTDDHSGALEDQLVANMQIINLSNRILPAEIAKNANRYNKLALGVGESLVLSNRIGPNQLNIPWNSHFGHGLVMIEDSSNPPEKISIGTLELYLLGPFKEDLEELREEWDEWLRENQEAVIKIRREAEDDAESLPIDEGQLVSSYLLALASELGDRNAVTAPNLASIMFLLEENGKSVLMTGDGHWEDILKGLDAHGKLGDNGRLHVDVLKLQHHGSEHNIKDAFCKAITADHYIICANGSDENPDIEVIKLIIDSRIGEEASGPHAHKQFKLWFNSSVRMAGTESREDHMKKVEQLVRERAQGSGQPRKLHYRFLTRGSSHVFEI